LPLPAMWNRRWNAVWRASEPGCKPIGKLSGDGCPEREKFAFRAGISCMRRTGLLWRSRPPPRFGGVRADGCHTAITPCDAGALWFRPHSARTQKHPVLALIR